MMSPCIFENAETRQINRTAACGLVGVEPKEADLVCLHI